MTGWIADDDALRAHAATLAAADVIGLDTEFMRVHTYWPELALVQTAHAGRVALVDPLAVATLAPLAPVLAAERPVLIMHSASEDLVALAPIAPLRGLFDTQVAAAFAGLGAGIGYQRLVLELLGIALEKGETRSNWLARPLSVRQMEYAAADVQHLEPLHDALRARLEQRDLLRWCLEECARLAQASASGDDAARRAHWEFRNAWRWPLEQQARLRALLEWREATARRVDRPRLWILDNPAALSLAAEPPASRDDLAARLAAQRAFPRAALDELQSLLTSAPDPSGLEPIPTPMTPEQERRFEALRSAAAARAAALDLPPALLASRRMLEAAARGERPPELDGWRREALGAVLEG